MMSALDGLRQLPLVLRIKHQTGPADFERVQAAYAQYDWEGRAEVRSYIDNMVADFAAADLVVCRAGATTTAELIAAGKASIMIPFPLAADDHQRKNAEAMQVAGAARMILQKDLTAERLVKEIGEVTSSAAEMGNAAKRLSHGDAAAMAVDMIEELAGV
jgi:UDP-N-acetylglucosamine--N-acetylmuramyl-(pentapeptide) pyrophosphoryl-undecaprenol N-acetylglucosamine transferase